MRSHNHRIGGYAVARAWASDASLGALVFILLVCGQGCIGFFAAAGNYTYAEGMWTGTLAEVSRDSVAADPSGQTGGSVLVLEVASHPDYEWRHYRSDEVQDQPVDWAVTPRQLLLVDDETGRALVEQDGLTVGRTVRVEGNYNSKRFNNSESGDEVTVTSHPVLDGVLYVRKIIPADVGDDN